ncbi:hypothetical protein IAR55_001219 [Kwoniella newhampshirensis]|uniref:SET domain-containing protein n=1 Tax=Kwoniella newhampshirensis TaxID=1651941 RepID=A0AAW0Z505_9TREE
MVWGVGSDDERDEGLEAMMRRLELEREVERVTNRAREAYERNASAVSTLVNTAQIPSSQTVLAAAEGKVKIETDLGGKRILQVFRGGPSCSSARTIKELQRVNIRDLNCPARNEGKILVCRVLTETMIGNGITFHVEDPEELALPLTMPSPTPHPSYGVPATVLQNLFPQGTIIALKEPDVRFALNGSYALRADVPTDVCFINGRSSMVSAIQWCTEATGQVEPSWEEHKLAGNIAMGRKELMTQMIAVRHYTLGMGDPKVVSDPYKSFQLLCNRAQAYLNMRQFGSAYRDCHRAQSLFDATANTTPSIEITPDQRKKLYWRMMKAAYGLRLYDHAQKILTTKCSGLSIPDLPNYVLKIVTQKTGASLGRYDWSLMWKDMHSTTAPHFEVSDYTGPIEVQLLPGRGRGLIITQDVHAGQVLLASKALITGFLSEAPNTALSGLDFERNITTKTTQVLALDKSIHALIDDPSVITIWNSLHSGREDDPESAKTDFPRITEEKRLADILYDRPPQIDVAKISGTLDTNAFGVSSLSRKASEQPGNNFHGEAEHATMLFGLPSLANHSCLPNVTVSHWGDVVVYRALHDLSSGSELLVSYFSPEGSFMARCGLAKEWGFTCTCALCVADESDDYVYREILMERDYSRLMEQSDSLGPREFLRKWMELEKEVAATYAKGRKGMQPDLRPIWRAIAALWWKIDGRRSIPAERFSLECIGTIFSTPQQRATHGRTIEKLPIISGDGKIESILYIARAQFVFMGNPVEGNAWARTAFWAHETMFGGGLAIFLERFEGKLPHRYEVDWAG